MISIKELRVDYDRLIAVNNVDLAVRSGEILGLVGPNGAGKTSLIKAAVGLIEPVRGRVVLGGVDMSRAPEEGWRRLGYMPDFSPVYEELTVSEYLDVFAAAYGIPRRDRIQRCKYWAERVNLHTKWNDRIHDLSRGMRQRLVFAKTLLPEPDILFLDEPASGMDPLGRIDLREILKEKAENGTAVLISSHILSEMDSLCTALAVMEKGRILVSGTLEEIRTALHSQNRLHIQILPPVESALTLLETWPGISGLQPEEIGGLYSARFSGDKDAAAALLVALHEAGARVSEFWCERDDVESLFLQIGGKEVS